IRACRAAKYGDTMPREECRPDGRRHQFPSLLVQLFEGLFKLAPLLVYAADQAGTLFRSVDPTGRVLPESEGVHDFPFYAIGDGFVLPLRHRNPPLRSNPEVGAGRRTAESKQCIPSRRTAPHKGRQSRGQSGAADRSALPSVSWSAASGGSPGTSTA